MSRVVELEAARRSFLAAGAGAPARDLLRAEVAASWERSRQYRVDPDRITARFLGHRQDVPLAVRCADEVFERFVAANPDAGCSLVLFDGSGVVRARRDADAALARLLDGLLLVPGYGYAERTVGSTAAAIAQHDGADVALSGPEHYHAQLTCVADAAALLPDPHGGEPPAVVAVLCHASDHSALQLPLARQLADRGADRMAGDPDRRAQALLAHFRHRDGHDGEWALATDGNVVLSGAAARRLDPADQRVLADLALSGLVLGEFGYKHLDLPAAGCAEVVLEGVHLGGELIGSVLTGARSAGSRAEAAESVRRQGSHVAPLTRRDYAQDLRVAGSAHEHAEARVRANRELLSPFLRARQEVVAAIRQGRNHLLIGEPGVGKRTLLAGRFREVFPSGRIVTVDCGAFGAADAVPQLPAGGDGRPQLLLLRGLNLLTPVGARRLDEALRPVVALCRPPLVVGCIDTPALDATRPYGLLLRHFHQVTRIPALRYRADEIGEIALGILRRLSGRRSLRLSLQVIRVLEGYAWPGNVSELEDVLRYVVARKPLGEVQPPDLPALCFQGRARRLSMLEAAQCDAIIQALYESRGNRYKAAAMLGIARSSLYRKIDAFGISYIA